MRHQDEMRMILATNLCGKYAPTCSFHELLSNHKNYFSLQTIHTGLDVLNTQFDNLQIILESRRLWKILPTP